MALGDFGVIVSPNTVARLLHRMGYSLRVNHKKLSTDHSPDRNAQFLYLGDLRDRFQRRGHPIISVDTKKRELVGDFKNPGMRWDLSPRLVNDHDFRSDSTGVAIPYGICDLLANRGSVVVGDRLLTSFILSIVSCVALWIGHCAFGLATLRSNDGSHRPLYTNGIGCTHASVTATGSSSRAPLDHHARHLPDVRHRQRAGGLRRVWLSCWTNLRKFDRTSCRSVAQRRRCDAQDAVDPKAETIS